MWIKPIVQFNYRHVLEVHNMPSMLQGGRITTFYIRVIDALTREHVLTCITPLTEVNIPHTEVSVVHMSYWCRSSYSHSSVWYVNAWFQNYGTNYVYHAEGNFSLFSSRKLPPVREISLDFRENVNYSSNLSWRDIKLSQILRWNVLTNYLFSVQVHALAIKTIIS